MPRDADATRKRILDAATAEFAAHGLAGARVDRIAEAALANKGMIYAYYGSKDELFTTVIEAAVQEAHASVPLTPDDLPGYATALFDYILQKPALARLETWRKLEGVGPSEAEREMYRGKLDSLAGGGRSGAAADILAQVMAIAGAWFSAPEALHELTTNDTDHQRSLITDAVIKIAARHTTA